MPDTTTWHAITRLNAYGFRGADGISLKDFIEGLRCFRCHAEREWDQLMIFDGQFACINQRVCDASYQELIAHVRPVKVIEEEAAPQKPKPMGVPRSESGKRQFQCTQCGQIKVASNEKGRLPSKCEECKAA